MYIHEALIHMSWYMYFQQQQSHHAYISPLSVLERLDPALGVNGTMKSGKEEVAQIVRYASCALRGAKDCSPSPKQL